MKDGDIQVGDILMTSEAPLGETYLVKRPLKAILSQRLFLIRLDQSLVDPWYFYTLMQSKIFREQLVAKATGTTVIGIKQKELRKIEIELPEKSKQKKIGKYFQSIDAKLDINRQINANLDELLLALYSHLVSNKLCNANLNDICSISNRKIPVSDLRLSNYWSNTNLLPDRAGSKIADKLPKVKNVNKVEAGDILFGNIRPYFKKVMYASYNGGASTDVVCFHPNSPAISEFLYSIIYSDEFISSVVKSSKGTKMPRGDKKQMMSYKIYLPTKEEIESFHKQANVILQADCKI